MTARIEVVRGAVSEDMAARVVDLWMRSGALSDEEARRRVKNAAAVALDGDDLVAVSTVRRDRLPILGARDVWVYRRFVPPAVDDRDAVESDLFNRTFESLDADYVPGSGAPMGVCRLVRDAAVMRARPEVIWEDTGLMYAGYRRSGEQVRVRWLGPGSSVADTELAGETIHVYGETDAVSEADVLDLWAREAGVTGEAAQQRLGELALVATDASGCLAGMSTVALLRHPRLEVDVWFYRVFVSTSHRGGNLAVQFVLRLWELFEARWRDGDRRGLAIATSVEHEGLKRHLPEGLWATTRMVLVGDAPNGAHVRVRWFPGATAPLPGTSAAG